VGPLLWDRPRSNCGTGRKRPLVLVVGSTASSGRPGLLDAALAIDGVRIVAPMLQEYVGELPRNAVAGPGRLAPLIERAAVVISGAGTAWSGGCWPRKPLVLVPAAGSTRARQPGRPPTRGIVVHRLEQTSRRRRLHALRDPGTPRPPGDRAARQRSIRSVRATGRGRAGEGRGHPRTRSKSTRRTPIVMWALSRPTSSFS